MTTTNRLAGETSPYLRQHAANPVDWYPWGEEAFAAARRRDVPILLSVGYSACHWCHVMAHESFEDPATAATMNELFVNVKVDREERPDVDAVYMEAVQATSGSGGWPMTVFLLPDGRPFFAGTYFPRDRLAALLRRVGEVWRSRRDGIEADAGQLVEAIRAGTGLPSPVAASQPSAAGAASQPSAAGAASQPGAAGAVLPAAVDALLARYDAEWGGFATAPKFPQPPTLELLLRAGVRHGREDALAAAVTTLDAMASGGIYDHLGGGFARYATDRRWLVPHFEKMLYDNALLARTYARAWAATGLERYRQVVEETVGYLLRAPMRQATGGLSSAEDADSEGEEGRFYTWSLDELRAVGGPAAVGWYGASEEGNWESRNILWRPERGALARPPEVEAARAALYQRREQRSRPGLDDKVLTEWNAMAVAAVAEAGATLARPEWVDAAGEIAGFLLAELRVDGRWRRSWQAGTARHSAYASDHAWLVDAFTRLAEATGRRRWLEEASGAAWALLERFWDPEEGGFFTTASDAEALVARTKDTYDGALPSANSVAAEALLRLGALTGTAAFSERSRQLVDAMGPALATAPAAFSAMSAAADLDAGGVVEVVVTGDRPDLLAAVRSVYRPDVVVAWGEPFDSPLWEGRTDLASSGLAFVCRDYACAAPAATVAELVDRLGPAAGGVG